MHAVHRRRFSLLRARDVLLADNIPGRSNAHLQQLSIARIAATSNANQIRGCQQHFAAIDRARAVRQSQRRPRFRRAQ